MFVECIKILKFTIKTDAQRDVSCFIRAGTSIRNTCEEVVSAKHSLQTIPGMKNMLCLN